jgi:hypothetical protein
LSDGGTVSVFVGYPNNHANDVYRLLNLKTNLIMKSRDVIWSNKSYLEWIKSKDNLKKTKDDLSEMAVRDKRNQNHQPKGMIQPTMRKP